MIQENFKTVRDTTALCADLGGTLMRISWRAIIAGWLVAFAIGTVLYLLGSAIGITSLLTMSHIESAGKQAAIGVTIWMFITWFASLYCGSFFASRVSIVTGYEGMLQGVVIWALASVFTIMVGLSGLSIAGMMSMKVVEDAAQSASSVAGQAGKTQVPLQFQAQLKQRILESASSGTGVNPDKLKVTMDQLKPQTLNDIGVQFLKGDVDGAKNALLLNTSLTRDEADRVVKALSRQTEELKAKIEEGARKVAAYTAAAFWCSLIISLFALGAAMFGGKVGAYNGIVLNSGNDVR
jgi:hypothetical protein